MWEAQLVLTIPVGLAGTLDRSLVSLSLLSLGRFYRYSVLNGSECALGRADRWVRVCGGPRLADERRC